MSLSQLEQDRIALFIALDQYKQNPSSINLENVEQACSAYMLSISAANRNNVDIDKRLLFRESLREVPALLNYLKLPTTPDTGWVKFIDRSISQWGIVSDSEWIKLRNEMTEGIKVVFNDGDEWFAAKDNLINASCISINTVNSLQSFNSSLGLTLAWSEDVGCNAQGVDYSVVVANRTNNLYQYNYSHIHPMFDQPRGAKDGMVRMYIK